MSSTHTPEDAAAAAGGRVCAEEEAAEGPRAGPGTDEPNPGPGSLSAEARKLADWAESLGGNWAWWAQQKCASYPAEWIRVLLEDKVQGCVPHPREPYLNAILRNWAQQGYCELLRPRLMGAGPVANPAPGSNPARPRRMAEATDADWEAFERELAEGA